MIRVLLRYLHDRRTEMWADLARLVQLESPSDDPSALARCADELGRRATALTGGHVTVIAQAEGPHLDITVGADPRPPVLVLGHYDTVWPLGTIATRPYEQAGGIARGPGVFDMKAGLVQGLWAAHALHVLTDPAPPLRFLFTSDEEVQSLRSRALIEAAARTARIVLVLEPSLDGALKTARRGGGRFTVSVRGRAAHAGLDAANGRSAIGELARVIEYLHSLTDPALGTAVNVGVISGGTRANVVAAHASAEVDVRVATPMEEARLDRLLRDLRPSCAGLAIEVTGGIVRPPMPRTRQTGELFETARTLAAEIGLELTEASAGGGSDANFCAALGIPVLDGLGAVGGGAHADDEHVLLEEMAPRAALVGALMAGGGVVPAWAREPARSDELDQGADA